MIPNVSKNEIREMEYMFYNEYKIRRIIRERRLDPNPKRLLIKPSNRIIGDPTGNTVIRKLSKLQSIELLDGRILKNPEIWIEIIDETYLNANELEYRVARSRYRGEKASVTISRLQIELWKYYRVLNQFRKIAIGIIKNKLKK